MGLKQEVMLDADIEKLEAEIYGTNETEAEGDSTSDVDDQKPNEKTTSESEAQTVESETTSTEKQKVQADEDWEHRYKKLRAASDAWKHKARQEIAAKDAKISSLEKIISEIPKPEVDIFKDAISEEDTALLGEKAVETMKRVSKTAADNASAPLKAELAEAKRKAEAKVDEDKVAEANARSTNFINRLSKVVEDYEAINYDPGFERFLLEDDPINGGQRMLYFKRAEKDGDVSTVAKYMREFSPVKVDKLADKIDPNSTTVSTTDTDQLNTKLLPVSKMEEFYDKVSRNFYRGKASLQTKHQAYWDAAVEEGRIDYRK